MTPVVYTECVVAVSSGVLVVTDVSDSPSSVVVLGEALLSGSDCEIELSRSPLHLSRKRQAVLCGESRRHEL